jgi:hypothetical protein
MSPLLFVGDGGERIEPGGSPGRPGGCERSRQERRDQEDGEGGPGDGESDAPGRQRPGGEPGQQQAGCDAGDRADEGDDLALDVDHAPQLGARHADRAQHPDIPRPLGDGQGQGIDDPEQADDDTQGQQRFRIVGIFQFGGAASLGPAQFAAADLPVAQQIFDKPGMVDEIDVAARPGIPASALTAAIQHILPGTAKVTTATAQAAAATADVDAQFNLLRYALLASGVVALFTGSFIIFNTPAQQLSSFVTKKFSHLLY